MTPIEKEYRSISFRIGISLLILLVLLFLRTACLALFPFFATGLEASLYESLYQLLAGLLYALAFLLPVFVFSFLSRGIVRAPIYFSPRLPRNSFCYLFAGLAVLLACSWLGAQLVSLFDYSAFADEVFVPIKASTNLQLILQFLTLAVIPAFVEELLFRGVILSALMPYGKTAALITSALLFGVMHQNVAQFFFATAAGFVLGYLYLKTKSIWLPVILHFLNNFYSLFSTAITERLSVTASGNILWALQLLIFALGLLSAILLICQAKSREGEREHEFPPDAPDFAVEELSEMKVPRRIRLTCALPLTVFSALCLAQMLLYLGIAILFF